MPFLLRRAYRDKMCISCGRVGILRRSWLACCVMLMVPGEQCLVPSLSRTDAGQEVRESVLDFLQINKNSLVHVPGKMRL